MQLIINSNIIIQEIKESNKIIKNATNLILLVGSLGFLTVGISSFLSSNLVPFLNASRILFFPQGLVMSIYGTLGTLLSINQIIILYYEVGNGYNEFDKRNGTVKIFRKGFPINNKNIEIIFPLEDIVRSI